MKILIFSLIGLIGMILFISCDKNDDNPTQPPDPVEVASSEIKNLYMTFSDYLKEHDLDSALSCTYPGSDIEGNVRFWASHWDPVEWGPVADMRPEFTEIEVWMTEEWLSENYGEVVGNSWFIYPGDGDREFYGFYSATKRLDNEWKLFSINVGLDPDWWKR